MEGWEVELEVADHYNRLWEEMNDVPEEPESDEPNLYKVQDYITDALDNLYDAINSVEYAVEDSEGDPVSDKIAAVLDKLKDCDNWLSEIKTGIHNELIRRESESA